MKSARTIPHRLLGVLVAVVGLVSHARADTITLKPSARIAGDRVTLGEIAQLEGSYAQSLAGTVVMDDLSELVSEGCVRLTIEQLRVALDQSDPSTPVRWGVLSLRGGEIVMRRRGAESRREAVVAPVTREGEEWLSVESLPGDTVRWHIGQRLRQILGETGDNIRVQFETADTGLLDTPTAGRVVEVSINAKGGSAPASVKVFERDRLITSGTARVKVEVRRQAVIATTTLSRGDLVGSHDVQIESRWISPDLRVATSDEARGSEVRTRLEPGKLILLSDIESPVIVKRGDLVNVHVHAGSIALKTTARAKGNGRVGDIVTFESLTDKTRTYRARMSGPGTAVTITPEEEARIPETRESLDSQIPQVEPKPPASDPALSGGTRALKPSPEQSRAAVGGVVVERRANPDGTESVKVQPPEPGKKPRTLKFFPVDE